MSELHKVGPYEELLLRCCCGEPQYLRIEAWDIDDPEPFIVGFVNDRVTLRSLLRQWWHGRTCWSTDVNLSKAQLEEFVDFAIKLLAPSDPNTMKVKHECKGEDCYQCRATMETSTCKTCNGPSVMDPKHGPGGYICKSKICPAGQPD